MPRSLITLLLLTLLLLGAAQRTTAEPMLTINTRTDHYLLANLLSCMVDDNAHLTFEQARTNPDAFVVRDTDAVVVGFSRAALWCKLNLHNTTPNTQNLLLVIAQPLLLEVSIYDVRSNGSYTQARSGIYYNNESNARPHRYPNYRVTLNPDEARSIYYRVTASNILFPLSVWKEDAFTRNDHIDQYITGFYYGMLALVGIYNFLMFFIVREKSHLYYVFFLASFICAMATIEGVLMEHHGKFFTQNSLLILYVFNHLMLFFLTLYASLFMDLPDKYPRLDRWLRRLGWLALLTMPMPFIFGVHGFDIFHGIFAGIVCTAVLGGGFYVLLQGSLFARDFMVAWSMLLAGALVYMLTVFGVLPHNHLTANAIQIGSVFEAILQSLGLAAKIAQLKKESIAAHESALQIQKQANLQLEDKVRERTHALESLTAKLAKYLSPQVYSSIFHGQNDVRVETRRKKLTVFFSDIKGFTEMTDSLESEVLSSLLNNYLDEMAQIALKHGGTIDKFIGDAVMVFFGDPESNGEKEDAIACVRMALDMRDRMIVLREKWKNEGIYKPLRIRCGINTGYCTVGNFGCENRMDYTIVGGQVNLASRLESNAQPDQILISHETYALVKEVVACVEKGEITVKGIARPVQTYQVLDLKENIDSTVTTLSAHHDGFVVDIDLHKTNRKQAAAYLQGLLDDLNR
ncbi:MAG: hypothetical protein IT470_08600 [Pseudomonadales bacterium]|nr:hypothetical protein [Pseudomonadales bacterium]